ncbi:hypothetical protein TRIUR3_23682 [Triticum urartu]|uniref:Uncharacterized protein n=1 Tax=Triticum urartu TaxID=4572 RepID=M7ZHM1_TRIUA|nr:hypothetical protein TRIUR3_23682 [Triticum urartu]
MAIKLSKWNGPVGVIAPAAGTISDGAATGSTTATDAVGGGAGTIGITTMGGAVSEAAGGSTGSVSPEVAGMMAIVEEDPEEAITGGGGTTGAEAVASGDGGIGTENREPTAVVPKN